MCKQTHPHLWPLTFIEEALQSSSKTSPLQIKISYNSIPKNNNQSQIEPQFPFSLHQKNAYPHFSSNKKNQVTNQNPIILKEK